MYFSGNEVIENTNKADYKRNWKKITGGG